MMIETRKIVFSSQESDSIYHNVFTHRELEFFSVEEARDLYIKHATYHDFDVRKDEVTRNTANDIPMKQFVCNRHKFRHHKHFERTNRKRAQDFHSFWL